MNKYEIVGIVGEGAYGIVYKAKNKENGEFGKWIGTNWTLNSGDISRELNVFQITGPVQPFLKTIMEIFWINFLNNCNKWNPDSIKWKIRYKNIVTF